MSASLDVGGLAQDQRQLDRFSWIVFGCILAGTALSLLAVLRGLPWQVMFALPIVLALVWVIRAPQVGLYLLFAAALLIPVDQLGFPDAFTDSIPFWINLSGGGSLNVSGLGITPAEILMVAILIGTVGSINAARVSITGGRLMKAFLLFGVAVAIGEVNGMLHGGDFKLSLWELRPPVYAFFAFIIATLLLRVRKQLKILLAIVLIGELFMGITGCFRYFVTLDRSVANAIPIMAHEDSYLLSLFVAAVAIGIVWFRRPVLVLLIAAVPIVVTALVENHRRAGTGALVLEILTVLVLAYFLEPRLRKNLLVVGAALVVAGAVFTVVFWNQEYGALAELIRPIKSIVSPNVRDLSSDTYRIAETANLRLTFRSSPILGVGFGHPYFIVYPQTGVQKYDPLWNIIPHNNLMWIPMRMGIVGMVTFWAFISIAIIQAIATARSIGDRLIRGAMVFAVAAILGLLFTGYYDIAIENYRNAVVLGLVLAVINRGAALAREEKTPSEPARAASGHELP